MWLLIIMDLTHLTQSILNQIPAALMPTPQEGELIRQYKSFFNKHENELINGFYDLVFQDETTINKLNLSERKQREQTLRQWYQVTTNGCFDNDYWQWQAFIGIVHVKHDIPNPTLISMWGWIISFLQEKLFQELPNDEALKIMRILQKIQVVVTSLVVEGFTKTQRQAISNASGIKDSILKRFIYIEIDNLLLQGLETIQKKVIRKIA